METNGNDANHADKTPLFRKDAIARDDDDTSATAADSRTSSSSRPDDLWVAAAPLLSRPLSSRPAPWTAGWAEGSSSMSGKERGREKGKFREYFRNHNGLNWVVGTVCVRVACERSFN